MMSEALRTKVFWSGGSQAVRIPKEMRLPGTEVAIRRSGRRLVLESLPPEKGWEGFWDTLLAFPTPLVRHPTRSAEKRKPL